MEYPMDFVIQAGSNPIFTHVSYWSVFSNWNSFSQANNIDISKVTKISPKKIIVTPILNGVISYNFIEEVKVYISAPGLIKLPIGEVFPYPNLGDGDLFIIPGLANVKDYITSGEFRIDLEIRYREQIRTSTDHRLTLQFDVFE
jgi:hypothetical protein